MFNPPRSEGLGIANMKVTIRDLTTPVVGQSDHYVHLLRVLDLLRGRQGSVDPEANSRLEASLVALIGKCFDYACPFSLTVLAGGRGAAAEAVAA